ncbi:FCD domain-containing protein [Sinomonas mesophila]|uniref:FCD domain-containing protein n=1 Tax=Sinomonas mesophila TaxID=1531955 RepID=UPI00098746D7|nr:FCD domain-containing protein [Sinomonas mesophila]
MTVSYQRVAMRRWEGVSSVARHRDVVDAIEPGDADAARQAINKHRDGAAANLISAD